VIALPPLDVGAVHVRLTEPLPAEALSPVGADGGTTESVVVELSDDWADVPALFCAATAK
jgi:hypothetical protein